MKKINYKKLLGFVVSAFIIVLVFLPMVMVFAQDPPVDGSTGATIENPLGEGNDSVNAILLKIMDLVAMVGGVVVVFFIIYSGYTFVMAQGNPEGLKKAKDMFFATIIGGAILLGADVIANVVVGTVKSTITP
jgi:hypothetical protein